MYRNDSFSQRKEKVYVSDFTKTEQGTVGCQWRISRDRKVRKGKVRGESSVAEICNGTQMGGVDGDRS